MEELEPQKSTGKFILELVEIIVVAFALSWLLRTYVVEARKIPTGSMLPTIQLEDRVIVDKIFFKDFGHLTRGDIVVFRPPPKANATEDFIKRVIGLPGETLKITNGTTYINGQPLYEPYILEKPVNDYGPITIPQGYVFVMGDNRNNSDDSRVWGLLPIQNITGRTLFRYWPLNHFGALAR